MSVLVVTRAGVHMSVLIRRAVTNVTVLGDSQWAGTKNNAGVTNLISTYVYN